MFLNTKAVGKAKRTPVGKIHKVLVGFEFRPVRLRAVANLVVLTISRHYGSLSKKAQMHM